MPKEKTKKEWEDQEAKEQREWDKELSADFRVMEDREEVYGPPMLFFESYGAICEVMDEYAHIGQGKGCNYAHLSSMKMAMLKILRSCWCPDVEDNYVDGRNYMSIAEMNVGAREEMRDRPTHRFNTTDLGSEV